LIVSDAGALKEQASAGELIGVFPAGDTECLAELLTKVEGHYSQPNVSEKVKFQRAREYSDLSCRSFVNQVINHLRGDNEHS
jgi:hypothetical protein